MASFRLQRLPCVLKYGAVPFLVNGFHQAIQCDDVRVKLNQDVFLRFFIATPETPGIDERALRRIFAQLWHVIFFT
jgi:hypothetical protein